GPMMDDQDLKITAHAWSARRWRRASQCRVVDVQQFTGRLQRARTMARAEMGGVHDGEGQP
ncbi:hypothetical protein ACLOJK_023113, partial [Asimina triloba]